MFNDTSEKETELRLLVHTGAVGAVIGKGGHKIKQIRELSGANVKAYQNCAPQSSERVISIRGEREALVPALRLCFQVIVENGQRGAGMPYDPANFDAYFAHEYGGYGGGGGGGGGGVQAGRFGPDVAGGGASNARGGGGMRMRGGRGGGAGGGLPPGGGPPLGFPGGPAGYVAAAGGGGFPARPPMGRGFGIDAYGREVAGFGPPPPPVRAKFSGGGPEAAARFGGAPGGGGPEMGWTMGKVEEGDDGPRDVTQVTIPKDLAGAIIGENLWTLFQKSPAITRLNGYRECGKIMRVLTCNCSRFYLPVYFKWDLTNCEFLPVGTCLPKPRLVEVFGFWVCVKKNNQQFWSNIKYLT
jgi:heterogeneous nuclear ribonucleoprotein K